MSIITKTGKFYGSAELLFADGTNWHAYYAVKAGHLLFGFIPFKKTVATKRFSFPQYSMNPDRDGFVQHMRDIRDTCYSHLNFATKKPSKRK